VSWDNDYQSYKHVWGDIPSELASFAVDYLQQALPHMKGVSILDIGCGYGRDALYLSQHIDCKILGIDSSKEAIEMALHNLSGNTTGNIEFRCYSFTRLGLSGDKYDIVFMSNLYQLLKSPQRIELQEVVKGVLRPGGLLFLSTLSLNDPEHRGRGAPIAGEVNSYMDGKYLHFCTREELESDFSYLDIKKLIEHEYYEPRANGETHHHISWLLAGENISNMKAPSAGSFSLL
jgi:SAM-dependent methyltransferase